MFVFLTSSKYLQMMHAEHWSISNEKESLEILKYVAGNAFIDEIRAQTRDKTIEWRLDSWDPQMPVVLGKYIFKFGFKFSQVAFLLDKPR